MMRNLVILGANGMLGTDLSSAAKARSYKITALDLPEFDITCHEHIKDAVKMGDFIINCAAYTNVDKAETEEYIADKVNAFAVGVLAEEAKKAGKAVIHISTDFVFDGKLDRPYCENDTPGPINAYGRSKLKGEQYFDQTGCAGCILRVEWTYGKGGNNFVKKLSSLAAEREMLKVVEDQVGSPTSTTEVSEALLDLAEDIPESVFHFAADGFTSRYEMADYFLKKLGIDIELKPCKSSDFQTPAQRPLNSRFNCEKIKPLLSGPIRHWQEPLDEYLRTL